MRNALLQRLSRAAVVSSEKSALLFSNPSLTRHYAVAASSAKEKAEETVNSPREDPGLSNGLNWALAGRGVTVDKVLHNLNPLELRKNGAATIHVEISSGFPLYLRGNAVCGASKISKAQFAKFFKQVTTHISSISKVFVQDGAIASASKCDAKVRVISDSPSAALSLSNILSEIPSRAVSHDSCPLTVYIASSISPRILETFCPGSHASTGFIAADVELSSLILCGKAFADNNSIKIALAALATPVISARGGLPVNARVLVIGDSVVLLFASEDTIRSCPDLVEVLVSVDAGAVFTSDGVAPFFKSRDHASCSPLKRPAAVILASSDSTGVLPLISMLSPGQGAYHFLAGYQDGRFIPAYSEAPSPIDPLILACLFLRQLKHNELPCFLINVVSSSGKHITGKEIIKLAASTVSCNLPESKLKVTDSKVRALKGKYRSFLSSKFNELPEEFSF